MSAISFGGLGSGLDINGIVTSLVSAQRSPFDSRVARQQGELTTNISAMGALKSSLEDVYSALEKLADADSFQQRKATGNDQFIAISAEDTASTGKYDITVDRLAEAHKLLSKNTFASSEKLGEGTLDFSAGSTNFTINVTADTTLSELKDMINDEADGKGLSASIITNESGQFLVLNAEDTGEDNAIKITATPANPSDPANRLAEFGFDPSDIPASGMNPLNAATDAQITIDGTVKVTSTTNEFTDAIEGLTITAQKVHDVDDDDSTISVTSDDSAVQSALGDFVEAYNALVDMSEQLGGASEGRTGPLTGDSMLRTVMNSVRRTLTESFANSNGDALHLSQFGVETDQYGKLSFDKATFNSIAKESPLALEKFFRGSDEGDGFAVSANKLINYYTESNGLIDGRINSYNSQIDRLQDEYESYSTRMEAYEERLRSQFNAMDAMVASMNATSNYLQQQLANLPGVVKKSD